jgi:hypothetical protein
MMGFTEVIGGSLGTQKDISNKIKRASRLFDRPAFDCMGVNHSCPYIAVSQQLLNSPDIIAK